MNPPAYSRLIFMGTPDFARPSLKALLKAGEDVTAVYTQPDRPKGRGRKLTSSPVKALALSHGLPIYQPASLRDPAVQNELAAMKPDLLIVAAYGLILPPAVLDIPTWGAINVHASLLPKFRGAAPIQWAIITGEPETGITTMRLDAGLDTGDILLQQVLPILAGDTSQSLHDRLSELGAKVLMQTLEKLRRGRLIPLPQDSSRASYAPPLKKGQGEINWALPAEEIDCWIRGLYPWPGAYTFISGRRLIIHKAFPGGGTSAIPPPPGTVLTAGQGLIQIQCGQNVITLEEVQLEGHRRVPSGEFLKGFPLQAGSRLGR